MEKETHIEYLDKFAGTEIQKLAKEYSTLYEKRAELKQELKRNYGDEKEKQRKLDLLKYQVNEIESAKLLPNEEEELNAKRQIMLNSELIMENIKSADYNVNEVAIEAVNTAVRGLEKIAELDNKYSNVLEELRNTYYELEESGRDIASLNEDNCFEEEDRTKIEERLDLIFSLKRKYGSNIEEILEYCDKIKKELYEIENLEEYTNKIRKEIKELEQKMLAIAEKMNDIREKTAKILDEKITNELSDLEMKSAKFQVKIEKETELNKNGINTVEFLIKTNAGDTYKPLIKIASGGEMSRIMLGIKKVLADVDEVPVLVFDEIDTGISGVATNKVAEKLKAISSKHQVLCITHLAPIAAKGNNNYYINKQEENGRAKTKVTKLNKEQKIKEIARIASGEITEVSLKHAESLIG